MISLRTFVAAAFLLTLLAGCGSNTARDYGIKRISLLVTNADMSYPGQAVVWDVEANELFGLGGEFRAKVTMWCDQVWRAGDDSVNRALDLPLLNNATTRAIVERYADSVYHFEQSAPACLMEKGLIGGLVTVNRTEVLPEDTVTSVEVPLIQFYCVYDLNRDSLIFVDSLYPATQDSRGWYKFWQSYLTADGRYFVYDKHFDALRFDIQREQIDTVAHHCLPLVPVNSNEILTCERGQQLFRVYDTTLTPQGEVGEYAWQMLSAYKISENVFIVGIEERPSWYRRDEYMWVSLFDFNKGEYTRLFMSRFGQILDVEMEE